MEMTLFVIALMLISFWLGWLAGENKSDIS